MNMVSEQLWSPIILQVTLSSLENGFIHIEL